MTPLRRFSNPLWLGRKAYLWGRSALTLERDDVLCAFYPKTGSTWVRIFMYNLLTADKQRSQSNFTFDEVNFTMPEWGHQSMFVEWAFDNCPRLIKTHRPYNRLFRKNRAILFAREPRDVMISLWHYVIAKKEMGFSGDLKKLVYHPELGLSAYMNFYQSWKNHASLCIKYEDLRSSPLETFRNFLQAIEHAATDEQIQAALDASSMEQTRKAQQTSSSEFKKQFQGGFVFARKGSPGEGVHAFDDELNNYYLNLRKAHDFDLYDFEPVIATPV